MSSFAIGLTTVNFEANQDGFQEQYPTLLRTWSFEAILTVTTDYVTLAGLLSYPISIRSCPGSAGATMFADIGGGAGAGTLTLDNVVGSPFNAALSSIQRPSAFPGGGLRARVSFQEVP